MDTAEIFDSIMTDLSGRHSLLSEDSRWLTLFNSSYTSLTDLLQQPLLLQDFCSRLLRNNKATANFDELIVKTVERVQRLSQYNVSGDKKLVHEACIGLFIITQMLHYIATSANHDEAVSALRIPNTWPHLAERNSLHQELPGTDKYPLDLLLDESINVLGLQADWMFELKFFCTELWTALLSSSLYGSTSIFHKYLFQSAAWELQQMLTAQHASTSFLSSIAVRLVRCLLYLSLSLKEEPVRMNSKSKNSKGIDDAGESELMQELIIALSFKVERDNENAEGGFGSSSTSKVKNVNGLFGAVQRLWTALLKRVNPSAEYPTVNQQDLLMAKCDPITSQWPRERATQLLLLLLHQRLPIEISTFNPFRQAFALLTDMQMDPVGSNDEHDDIEMMNMRSSYRAGPSSNINSIHVFFPELLQALYNTLPNKNYILLLYSFLQMHPTFLEVLRTTKMNATTGVTWAQVVLLRCIQGLYDCCTTPSLSAAVTAVSTMVASAQLNHIYTTLVCILIIVQDSMLLEEIATHSVTLLWYRERPQTTFAVIDAVVLVMLRALTFAVYRVQDSYLLSNICAVFMNILPATRQLHPYTCERLVKTMISYTRRLHREYLASMPPASLPGQMAMPIGLQQVKIESISDYATQSNSSASTQTLDYSYHNENSRTRSESTASMAGGAKINITLLKAALLALLQFTSAVIHRGIKTNVSLLYALILDHETLFSFFSPSDKATIFLDDHLTMPVDITVQWQQALHNVAIILQVAHYYLNRIEASCGERGQRFFSAKEALAFLQEEIRRMESDPSLLQSLQIDDEVDEEGGEAMPSQVVSIICGQFPRGQDSTIAKFMYQEADNAADFFIPYIWSNILHSSPEFAWKQLPTGAPPHNSET